tara:strand:- start:44 stop:217 length:174 start_codon:yes stop_codon:yes gene_type:complete
VGTGKLRFTEFKYNSEGCTKAKEFLLAIGKWTDDVGRRDGWEIVGKANMELRSLIGE